jgi:AcrR family transcriptional regulator
VSSADLLLHPVRLRIVKAFLGDRSLTTGQIAAELADVPTGSLYRHIATLTGAGLLQVVSERRVRGTVEKTYTLRMLAAHLQPDEVEAMSTEEHAQAFMAYVAGLLGDFDRYLTHDPTPGRDGADYRVNAMWLTDAEYADFMCDLKEVLLARSANRATRERRRRMCYHVLLPAPEDSPDPQ